MWETTARPAVCADNRWYPAQPEALRHTVTQFMEAAAVEQLGAILGVIAPHAGYFFSGHVAGAAYRQVQWGDYDTVVLIGPDHTGAALGGMAIPAYRTWQTPLGEVPVAIDRVDALGACLPLQRVRHDSEHALEVQLPFLQVALSNFQLLPIIMGDQSPAACKTLGAALAHTIGDRKSLLVASTDLSHDYSDRETRQRDERTLSYVLQYDPAGLSQAVSERKAHACGGGPVAAVMWAAQALGASQAHVMKYATSADVWDNKSHVVGYAAVVLTR